MVSNEHFIQQLACIFIGTAVTHASRCRKGCAIVILVDTVELFTVSATPSQAAQSSTDPPRKWKTKLVATSEVNTPTMLPGRVSSTRRPRPDSELKSLSARGARPPIKGGDIADPPSSGVRGPGGGTKTAKFQGNAAEIGGPGRNSPQLNTSLVSVMSVFEASSLRGGTDFGRVRVEIRQ